MTYKNERGGKGPSFRPVAASKRRGHVRIALAGPTGSGKTYTGLLFAAGILKAM